MSIDEFYDGLEAKTTVEGVVRYDKTPVGSFVPPLDDNIMGALERLVGTINIGNFGEPIKYDLKKGKGYTLLSVWEEDHSGREEAIDIFDMNNVNVEDLHRTIQAFYDGDADPLVYGELIDVFIDGKIAYLHRCFR